MPAQERIPTGIAGLDAVMRGGLVDGNVVLVEGAAGTGKTLFGLEFVYRGAVEHHEPGIIVTFEVAPKKLIRDAASFGWNLEELQQQDKLKIIFTSPQVLGQELRSPDSLLLETAAKMGAKRLFVDGISLLRTVPNDLNNAGNGGGPIEMGVYRQLLQQLLEGIQRENLTAILSHEVTVIEQQAFALEVTEFLADTVIILRREQNRRAPAVVWKSRRVGGKTTIPDGRHDALVESSHLSELAQLSDQLQQRTNDLADANRRKDEFLAMLAHELRNPLAPIANSLQLLRLSGDLGPAVEHMREVMERQVKHLIRLVDDLLEVSRISRGKIALKQETVELSSIVASAVETSRPLIDAGQHQLAVSIPKEPIVLGADPVRLTQVIANLLNNAAKYTPEGGQIWLSVQRREPGAVISVRDTGIGIPLDMQNAVFDMFAQVDQSVSRAQGGLGIGLTLAKTFIELHGGSITALSAGPGKGSQFVIHLPSPKMSRNQRPSRLQRA